MFKFRLSDELTTKPIPYDKIEKLFPIFMFYEEKGFNDKQQMINLVTWLTAFVFSILGFWGVKYFSNDPFPRTMAIVGCSAALLLSVYAFYNIRQFLNHAEANYSKAAKVINDIEELDKDLASFFLAKQTSFKIVRNRLKWHYVGDVFIWLLMWSIFIGVLSGLAAFLSAI